MKTVADDKEKTYRDFEKPVSAPTASAGSVWEQWGVASEILRERLAPLLRWLEERLVGFREGELAAMFTLLAAYLSVFLLPTLQRAVEVSLLLNGGTVAALTGVEVLAFGGAALATAGRIERLPLRRMGMVALVTLAVVNLLSTFAAGVVLLFLLRPFAGLASGFLAAASFSVISRGGEPEKRFAVAFGCLLGIGVLVLSILSGMESSFRHRGMYAFLGLALLAVIPAAGKLPTLLTADGAPEPPSWCHAPRLWLVLGLALFVGAANGVMLGSAFGVGLDLQIPRSVLRGIQIVGLLVGLGGVYGALRLGTRWGHVKPLLAGLWVAALAALLTLLASGTGGYLMGSLLHAPAIFFALPFVVAWGIAIDGTGRTSAGIGAMLPLGAGLGGFVAVSLGGWLGAPMLVLSVLLFSGLACVALWMLVNPERRMPEAWRAIEEDPEAAAARAAEMREARAAARAERRARRRELGEERTRDRLARALTWRRGDKADSILDRVSGAVPPPWMQEEINAELETASQAIDPGISSPPPVPADLKLAGYGATSPKPDVLAPEPEPAPGPGDPPRPQVGTLQQGRRTAALRLPAVAPWEDDATAGGDEGEENGQVSAESSRAAGDANARAASTADPVGEAGDRAGSQSFETDPAYNTLSGDGLFNIFRGLGYHVDGTLEEAAENLMTVGRAKTPFEAVLLDFQRQHSKIPTSEYGKWYGGVTQWYLIKAAEALTREERYSVGPSGTKAS